MLATLSSLDYGILGLYPAAMLAVGVYFSGRQRDAGEFLLASRSLGQFPLGISLVATLAALLGYTGLPGDAYEHGLACLIIPASFWLILPLVVGLVIPVYRGLGLSSLYEYLELRFDGRVRLAASLIFVVWRLVWLVAAIYLPVRAFSLAAGWPAGGDWWLIGLLGVITTLYTFLGGLRAVAWTGVIHALAMLLGLVVVIAGVWSQTDGGAGRIAEIAAGLGRTQAARLTFSWTDSWSLWGALPHWALVSLSFYIADQFTAQRYLSAKSVNAARTSYVIQTLGLSLLLPGLIYAGLCLLAFYYDHPQSLRPEWVVNVDGVTRKPLRDAAGQPLLDENDPAHEVRWENIERLVAEGRILQPNNKEPFTSAEALIDPETNRVLVEKLAMRRPPNRKLNGEWIVRRGSPREMLPQFVAQHLPWGAAGLVLAALLAACMASIDCGIHSTCTLAVVDFHRRWGWGKAWLARRLNKQPGELTEADELRLARPLMVAIGLAATLLAMGISQWADVFGTLAGTAAGLAAPLLAVFLLGLLTRRTTAAAAFWALLLGELFAVGLIAFGKLAAAGELVPKAYAFAGIWHVVFSVLFTCVVGLSLSLFVGRQKPTRELRDLVAGCGPRYS